MHAGNDTQTFAASAGTPYAAEAAAEVFRAGGNAADAAVAASAAVGVTEPLMSSIGGGGFALVRSPDGRAEILDYYGSMPGKGLPASAFGAGGSPQTVVLKYGAGVNSTVGGASVAVPGVIRGWETLLRRHGRLTLRETLAPATRLAREGFRLCRTSGLWFAVAEEVLKLTDETRKNFCDGDRPYAEGETLRFPELAGTLERIGEGGARLFYEGELAREISSFVLGMGGIVTEEDLAGYEAVVREPMTVRYGLGEIHTNGPPSAGGSTLAQMLRVVSGYDLSAMTGEDFVKVMAGAMRLALEDRQTAYADGAENARVAERLTSEEYAKEQRRRIFEGMGGSSSGGAGGAAGMANTSHLSCVAADGLAVSVTNTMGYGSGLVVPGTGIPLNNALGEPELNPKGFHAFVPGERLISNMSPTVVSSEEGGLVSLGSPGASRIATAILQTLVNVLDFGMPLEEAVLAPRFHAEGDLFAYESGVPAVATGFDQTLPFNGPDMFFGGMNAVRRTPEGRFEAAADPRRSGGVAYA